MDKDLDQVKKDLEKQIVAVGRNAAHAMGDLDAAIDCVAKESDKRLKDLDRRVSKLENRDGV